jgi:hypothetical protein
MYSRYLQAPRLLISTIHVKLNMFEKMFHVSKGHTGEMFLTLSRTGNTRIVLFLSLIFCKQEEK